ncbi:TatD family hydrolase [Sporosarcina sp. P33]|uniref:TatD family hydrolase n=1 Tax=Sporosarcina sp. P33 TaxID=1930764 RepID=UPI0009C3AF75|nr:TatD family hydrolase [Sporosarcina sp. P33]ARD48355.1 DNAase [Sporosarcina sp. P33]
MKRYVIDSHIHLDMYEEKDRVKILSELDENDVTALVAVSNDLASSYRQLELSGIDSRIKAAVGYHPEQAVPADEELQAILHVIDQTEHRLTAIGEVGLPYYLRQQQPELDMAPYLNMLECFVQKAAEYELPIALHAVYEDADIVCDLLEVYNVSRAHFHWFKGDDSVLQRIIANGYMVSVTPEVTYRPKIQHIVQQIPLLQLMVESDGPWPFEESFAGKLTHPSMLHESIKSIAGIKRMNAEDVYNEIYEATRRFYRI